MQGLAKVAAAASKMFLPSQVPVIRMKLQWRLQMASLLRDLGDYQSGGRGRGALRFSGRKSSASKVFRVGHLLAKGSGSEDRVYTISSRQPRALLPVSCEI